MKWLLFMLLFAGTVLNAESRINFTDEMANQCQVYVCDKGYTYKKFFTVDEEAENADGMTAKTSDKNVTFEMHIAIQGNSDGHILLTSNRNLMPDDPVYEIVIGGGANNFTELRAKLKRSAQVSKRTPNILSPFELRAFYVKQYSSGIIELGEEGATAPILRFLDTTPLDIKYYSFASWVPSASVRFLYDCPVPGSEQTLSENSHGFDRNMSASERLKLDKLQTRPARLAPLPSMEVKVAVKVWGVNFDAFEAKLNTRFSLFSVWSDEGLAWFPDKFNGIQNVTYRRDQIWTPVLHVFNSDNINPLNPLSNELITMDSDGTASFHSKASVETWCFKESSFFSRWPRDEYNCSIVIQAWELQETITFTQLPDTDPIIASFKEEDHYIKNEWELIEAQHLIVKNKKWNEHYSSGNSSDKNDRLCINLYFRRKATNYNMAFYTPLLVLMSFILMSFWSEPLQMGRIWFYVGTAAFISGGLCFIDNIIPCHSTPTILLLYIYVLYGILAALILQAIMMTATMDRIVKLEQVQSLLSSYWFRVLFCLPVPKRHRHFSITNDGYMPQDDGDAISVMASNGAIEEMVEDTPEYCDKKYVAESLDKLFFVVYSLLFFSLMVAHY